MRPRRKGNCNAECCGHCCPQAGCSIHRATNRRMWDEDKTNRQNALARMLASQRQQQEEEKRQQQDGERQQQQPRDEERKQRQLLPLQPPPAVVSQAQPAPHPSDPPAWAVAMQAQLQALMANAAAAPQARLPQPPPLPVSQHQPAAASPSAAPPSHLSSFPPPSGGTDLQAALALLRSTEVRPQPHSSVTYNSNPVSIHHGSFLVGQPPGPSATSDASAQPRMFSTLPVPLISADPAAAKKAPQSADELLAQLGSWLRTDVALRDDVGALLAWQQYVMTTVNFAHSVGMPATLAYNEESLRAAMREPALYKSVKHGPVYEPAHSHHIQPVLSARQLTPSTRRSSGWKPRFGDSASSPAKPAKRRKSAAPPDSPQSSLCSVHGRCGHSSADCRELRKKQKSAKKEQQPAAAATSDP